MTERASGAMLCFASEGERRNNRAIETDREVKERQTETETFFFFSDLKVGFHEERQDLEPK